MVFTNPIMTTCVNMIAYRALMSSISIGRYRRIDVGNLGGRYQKPFIITSRIHDRKKWSFCEAK
jgi:hypothetical protein